MRATAFALLALLVIGCAAKSGAVADPALAGSYRIYSERISYDQGGGDSIVPVTRTLELSGDGTWTFGSSEGTWSVAKIASGDWDRWGVAPYGPLRKIVLQGWDGAMADGPIEEGNGTFWAIYRPADKADFPGIVQMRFGRS